MTFSSSINVLLVGKKKKKCPLWLYEFTVHTWKMEEKLKNTEVSQQTKTLSILITFIFPNLPYLRLLWDYGREDGDDGAERRK